MASQPSPVALPAGRSMLLLNPVRTSITVMRSCSLRMERWMHVRPWRTHPVNLI